MDPATADRPDHEREGADREQGRRKRPCLGNAIHEEPTTAAPARSQVGCRFLHFSHPRSETQSA